MKEKESFNGFFDVLNALSDKNVSQFLTKIYIVCTGFDLYGIIVTGVTVYEFTWMKTEKLLTLIHSKVFIKSHSHA